MTESYLENDDLFPNLANTQYEITSPSSSSTNCIAYAIGRQGNMWPEQVNGYSWPTEISDEETIDAFIQLFERENYVQCSDGNFEEGFEKIALYTDSRNIPTHAAKQLANGLWTSKLGKLEDIEHEISGIEGDRPCDYGNANLFMKRSIADDLPTQLDSESVTREE